MNRTRFQKFPTHIRNTGDQISYPITFTEEIFTGDNQTIRRTLAKLGYSPPTPCAVLVDSGLVARNRNLIKQILRHFQKERAYLHLPEPPFILSGGETIKNSIKMHDEIASLCEKGHLTRETMVLIIGGGAFIDAAGTSLGQALGGIPFVTIPSSTLGQCAAGIGCCRFMNQGECKNFSAIQTPPKAVCIDFGLLKSLSFEHHLSGMAEAFKAAMACDADFFEVLCRKARKIKQNKRETVERVLHKTALLHLAISHPPEKGIPEPLQLGCWGGWWLESVSGFKLPHGHALSVGLTLDSWLALRAGTLPEETFERLTRALMRCGLPVWNRFLEMKNEKGELLLMEGLKRWKTTHGEGKGVVIPQGIGAVTRYTKPIHKEQLEKAINTLRQISQKGPAQERRTFAINPRRQSMPYQTPRPRI
ncbi:MAG: hypothetical protein MI742_00365 [Desulfobacterales bacterium]|nr:hypothetical protein [Desulfobacterales bacterium]